MSENNYDLVVIGGGPAGVSGANGAGFLGKRVALVEADSRHRRRGHQHGHHPEQDLARIGHRAFRLAFALGFGVDLRRCAARRPFRISCTTKSR